MQVLHILMDIPDHEIPRLNIWTNCSRTYEQIFDLFLDKSEQGVWLYMTNEATAQVCTVLLLCSRAERVFTD